jgi:hypothetical protein
MIYYISHIYILYLEEYNLCLKSYGENIFMLSCWKSPGEDKEMRDMMD